MFDKKHKNIRAVWQIASSTTVLGILSINALVNKIRLISLTLSKTQLKDLSIKHIKPEILKLLEEKVGNSLKQADTGNGFPI